MKFIDTGWGCLGGFPVGGDKCIPAEIWVPALGILIFVFIAVKK